MSWMSGVHGGVFAWLFVVGLDAVGKGVWALTKRGCSEPFIYGIQNLPLPTQLVQNTFSKQNIYEDVDFVRLLRASKDSLRVLSQNRRSAVVDAQA